MAVVLPRGSYIPTLQDPEILVDLPSIRPPNTGSQLVLLLNTMGTSIKLN